ncbi:MAG: DEAD/DEAH box helicase [Deltaproteobacteria bacterium]|nr:DEAD/DEAH box helicase [Deltaproteobacteria bacterium]
MESNTTQSGSVVELQQFSNLISDNQLLEALTRGGIVTPTPVQAETIPHAMEGKDLIVQAQTGSGKTLAFMLPILMKLRQEKPTIGTAALIITPTRELALQICKVVSELCPDIQPVCVIGGSSIRGQRSQLRSDRRVVVGTPGRLLDMIERRELLLRKCSQFVLDEADEMLSMGFIEDVRSILKRLPPKRQGMFFSATLPPRITMLAQSFLKSPTVVKIESNETTKPDIKHLFAKVSGGIADKASALCNILEEFNPSSAIIFCNTRSDTELLEVFMRRRGLNAQRINSDLSQRERGAVLDGLRSGTLRYLIATDVAARGIDIEHLELVVNYSIHADSETYVHRTGRTGRAGRSGTAISLVAPHDHGSFYGLRRSLEVNFEEMQVPSAASADRKPTALTGS